MTLKTNARLAGITYFVYLAAGITSMVLYGRATSGEGIGAKLAGLAQHATNMRIVVVLNLLTSFAALVLGVTLYAITRKQDPDLAMLAMICRVIEGVNGASGVQRALALLWLATASGASAPDPAGAQALGAFLLGTGWGTPTFFAVGSTLFAWLLLRGRMIPVPLAWLGVVASILLVVALPAQLVGLLRGPASWLIWLPLLLFEVPLALWLLIKGVRASSMSPLTNPI